jgi:single-strand DNA-binding protein
MAADNHTTIIGNLVEDPEVRFTNTGIAVTNLRVAVTQRVQQDGQWRDDTSFFKVNVWRGQAENLADSLTQGDRVMVTGRLRQRSWETPEGEKRSVTELEADEVGPRSSGPRPRSSAPASAATATAARAGSGRPNAATTSTTRRPSDQPFDAVGAPGFGRGRCLSEAVSPGMGGSIAPTDSIPPTPAEERLLSRYARLRMGSRTGVRYPGSVGTWHDPGLGRPIAAPLERCAELLGVDLASLRQAAAKVEPYLRADGTRIWSLTQLERQLRPEAYRRRRGGYLDRRRIPATDP